MVRAGCPNLCLRDSENNYWRYTAPTQLGVFLYPICEDVNDPYSCYMRALNLGVNPLKKEGSTEVISPSDQYFTNGTFKPITDSVFLKVTGFACKGCTFLQENIPT